MIDGTHKRKRDFAESTDSKMLKRSEERREMLPCFNKSTAYKTANFFNDTLIVPRQNYVKEKLKCYEQHIQNANMLLSPYRGMKPLSFENDKTFNARNIIYKKVSELPMFSHEMISDMTNGHGKKSGLFTYGYTIGQTPLEPIGCIYFSIDALKRECKIRTLGIDAKEKGKGYGAHLLEIAIYVGGLYGCRRYYLETSKEGKDFYAKYGFSFTYPKSKSAEMEVVLDEKHSKQIDCLMSQYKKHKAPVNIIREFLVYNQQLANVENTVKPKESHSVMTR